jgi:NAD(P)-dependent dehydrogenase (short-subunit alcohol dehydrogenase family)
VKLKDRVAIVTGAGLGIGRSSAGSLPERVPVAGIDAEAGRQVAGQIRKEGGEAISVQVDVSNGTDARMMCSRLALSLALILFNYWALYS